jgi:hypothetical protein
MAKALVFSITVIGCVFLHSARGQSTDNISGTYSGVLYPYSSASPSTQFAASITLNLDGSIANIHVQSLVDPYDPTLVTVLGFGSDLDSQGNGGEQFNLDYSKNGGQNFFTQDFLIQVQPAQYDYWGQIWTRTVSFWDDVLDFPRALIQTATGSG